MTSTENRPVTLQLHPGWLWLFRVGTPIAGFGLGFVITPVARWVVDTFGSAPGPLTVVTYLPTGWAVLVTTLLGLAAGVYVAQQARKESLVLTVDRDHVGIARDGDERHLPRGHVDAVFRDGTDLVLLDARTTELARTKASDLSWAQVQEAFERFGYSWRGSADPYGAEFTRWVDGRPDLDAGAHELLRRRARALKDDRSGDAGDALDRLRAHGIVVRDRRGAQEYRVAAGGA